MNGIRIISQVVEDLADGNQNTNDMVLRLRSDYTPYNALRYTTGGAQCHNDG